MDAKSSGAPDSTAVRAALWRALHVEIDSPPHVIDDLVGLKLAAPDAAWRDRPDMNPQWTRGLRASIVCRARFVEDLVCEQDALGVGQYVILGAGLDTFAQRRPDIASHLQIFEIDRPEPQAWKRQRLLDLGYGLPEWLHFVPVDFEAGDSWMRSLSAAGFDANKPAVAVSTGVSMYLTRDATAATLRDAATFAAGSTLAMTFLLPIDLLAPRDRPVLEAAQKGAAASGTPFATLFGPDEMLAMAKDAGFAQVTHISGTEVGDRYLSGRPDSLRPMTGEDFILAKT